MRPLALFALALLALLAASAQAATPIDLGPGSRPHVTVDRSGSAHLTWIQSRSGDSDLAKYCLLPTGKPACITTSDFTYPNDPNNGSDSGVWPLLPTGGADRILVLDARCCRNYASKFLYTSTDGGRTFTPAGGTEIGDDNNLGSSIEGGTIYLPAGSLGRPDESILTFNDEATVGLSLQVTGTTGPPPAATSNNILTGGDATNGSVGYSTGTLVVAWLDIDDDNVYFRKWSGTGDVNDNATWGPITPIEVTSIEAAPRLAYGPSGIFIAYNQGGQNGAPIKTVVRHFNGTGWDPPTTLLDPGATVFDLSEANDGTLHFVYRNSRDSSIAYRFSTTPGDSSFSPPVTVAPSSFPVNIRSAVFGDTGWATWESGGDVHAAVLSKELPPPTRGSTVNVVPVKGRVLVKLPPGAASHAKDAWTRAAAAGFVPLESIGRQIPVGSLLDTKKGTVRLFSATNNAGATQHGDFSRGQFRVGQPRKSPLTTVSMTGGGLKACGVKLPHGGAPKVRAAGKHRRSLFSNVKGRFRTRGRNSTATVRGTQFTVTDSCTGTLTKVKKGSVKVRDLWKRKTLVVKAGHSYLARRGNR